MNFSQRFRQTRSCARCRRLKSKCAFETPTSTSCIRCISANVKCSTEYDPTAVGAKKRRVERKPESNYIEEVSSSGQSASSSLLRLSRVVLGEISDDTGQISATERAHLISNLSQIVDKLSGNKTQVSPEGPYPPIGMDENLVVELISRGMISAGECQARFAFFLSDMLPYYPIISLSSRLREYEYLCQHHPLLLAACVSVTAVNNNVKATSPSIQVYNMLTHYLYNFLAYHIHIKCDDFSIQLVYVCQVLSAWCLPPHKLGHFKNQVNTLSALTVSLCMDLSRECPPSEQRNNLRALLSVYCTCGSLQLSLRRFRLVFWDEAHEKALVVLSRTSADRFLCHFARLIQAGQEMVDFLSVSATENAQFRFLVGRYEKRLESILHEYEDEKRRKKEKKEKEKEHINEDKEHINEDNEEIKNNEDINDIYKSESEETGNPEIHIMYITYYQLVVMTYDTLISRSAGDVFLQHVVKLVESCENMIHAFVALNRHTINFPTVLYYRPMNALVTMIKARLALRSSNHDLHIDIERYYDMVALLIDQNLSVHNSVVCEKMSFLLSKIEKWMRVSCNAMPEENVLVQISKSNNKEIESLAVPNVVEFDLDEFFRSLDEFST